MTCIAFDLDDTLYKERDFVRSGWRAVAEWLSVPSGIAADELYGVMSEAPDAFEALLRRISDTPAANVGIDGILETYRYHRPVISLGADTEAMLSRLAGTGSSLALITDGRSLTQWNKIDALGLDRFIDRRLMVVSGDIGADKNTPVPFETLAERTGADKYVYIGDNPAKDFHHSGRMGWLTIMLRDSDGANIHGQDIGSLPKEYRPQIAIDNITEITKYIQ